ncbi:MAG: GNAT family N-acetyltransferase [Chloroflexi bacterium]|uniref:GNAT family N-acetyltransferase n=1 Tax=Candidatus Flexifilum breve TaxID=3140694 RepID=UPI003136E71D|nr:GNAT family N-acetyltransferase [Chloroflexota bacterium]
MHTVYELPAKRFHQTAPLFAQAWFDEMYMEAVLLGRQPGRIFVNDLKTPTSAVMFRTYEYYLAGDPVQSLRQFLKDAPAEPGVFQNFYGWAPIGKPWEQALLDDFDALGYIGRLNFIWNNAPLMNWRAALPDGASIVALDAALAQQVDAALNETIGAVWSGYDRFEQNGGYGFALLMNGAPASVAFAGAVGTKAVNIFVGTADQFHRQGLAKIVCSAFIETTLARGLLPTWDTDSANGRSRALAKRLGFIERDPFVEIGSYPRLPLTLSTGVWSSEALAGGVTRWFAR